MARSSTAQERAEFLEHAHTDFEARLTRMAAEPAHWIEFLDTVALWGARYRTMNQLLLMMQAAERGIQPRYFMPYGKKDGSSGWLKHGRQVRKGETGFKVWAPNRRRPTKAQATEWEAAGRKVRRDPDGRPAIQLVGFLLESTFDISQTDGDPFTVPTIQVLRRRRVTAAGLPQLLTGDDPTGAFDDVVKLIKDEGYSFDLVVPGSRYLGDANGVTVAGTRRQVLLRDGMSPAQLVKTGLHELGHIRCGHLGDDQDGVIIHRGRCETEAESVAHIVCAALDLHTAAYSDAYVLGWADGDISLVKQTADTVLRVAKTILGDLTGELDTTDDNTAPPPGAQTNRRPYRPQHRTDDAHTPPSVPCRRRSVGPSCCRQHGLQARRHRNTAPTT
ncbi:ArdC family protein [Dactylosporangium sp. NPDC051485]|uniref:ArdC family protein n=1 Tax=Dactylosporangium sp. NPDC051485 TaxID=3154846 RepID=UPI003424D6A9